MLPCATLVLLSVVNFANTSMKVITLHSQLSANSTVPVSLKIQYRRRVKISLSGKLDVQRHQTLVLTF